MDQRTFIHRIARALDADPKETAAQADAMTEILQDCLADCDKVAIPGFGTFSAIKSGEHEETAADGTRMLMPPSIRVTFDAGSRLRKAAVPRR